MRADYTHIAVILDRSGSMGAITTDTIGGFNRFLADQKKAPGSATLTLVLFDHEYQIVHDFTPLPHVPELSELTYVPRGSTAYYDALGRTIDSTGSRLKGMVDCDRPGKVLACVITDGLENASKEYTASKLHSMINHQRDAYKWDFVFLGANQNAIQSAAAIGIPRASSMTYASNHIGTANAFDSFSVGATRLRSAYAASGAVGQVCHDSYSFTDEDREKQKQAGA